MSPDNPFAQPSRLPYQLPPFDRIGDADYRPAFIDGMAAQRLEIDAIAHHPESATFANTIVALERSGRLLERVETCSSISTTPTATMRCCRSRPRWRRC